MKSHQNPTDAELKKILTDAKTIAVVGASANEDRPSHGVMRKLISVGYRVVPVNPGQTEILGQKVYPSLSSIPFEIDIVDVFRKSEDTPPVAEEAVKIKAKVLWLQLGIHSDEAVAIAKKGGLKAVTDNCIAVAHSVFGIPTRRS